MPEKPGLGARRTRLLVYDLLGREVATLVDEEKVPGTYQVNFSAEGGSASGGDGSRLASGVYIYRLTAGDFVQARKMIVICYMRRRQPMPRILPFAVYLLIIVLLIPPKLSTQSKPWEAAGPEGGPILALVQHPTNPSVLLTVTLGDTNDILFRSTDRGLTWSQWGTNRQHGLWPSFGAGDESMVYASSFAYWGGSGFDVSSDGGQTWRPHTLPETFWISSLVPDPSERGLVHAAGSLNDPGMNQSRPVYWKGMADGSSGTVHYLNSSSGSCTALQVDAGNPMNIYVTGSVDASGQRINKFWRSADGGLNFSETNIGVEVYRLAVDPASPGRIFIAGYDQLSYAVFVSTDYGTRWTKSAMDFNNGSTSLVVTGGILYVSTSSSGVYKSTDGVNYTLLPGTGTWKKGWVSGGWTSIPCIQDLCVEATTPHTLLVATNMGIFRSTDGGTSWVPSNSGLHSGKITALRVAPGHPGILVAARDQDAVYKATSASPPPFLWERLPEFYACTNVSDLMILPTDPNVIFAMEGGG